MRENKQAAGSQASSGALGPAPRKGAKRESRVNWEGVRAAKCLPSWEGKRGEFSAGGAGRSHSENEESGLNPGKHSRGHFILPSASIANSIAPKLSSS